METAGCCCRDFQEVREQYTAVVKLVISGDKLKLDQSHLETVIPAPGESRSKACVTVRYLKDIFADFFNRYLSALWDITLG